MTDEEKFGVLFKKKIPEDQRTTEVWTLVIRFPFNSDATKEAMEAMRLAINLATGHDPLQVVIISSIQALILFDNKIHPQGQSTVEKITARGMEVVNYAWSSRDVTRLAYAYLRLGYFPLLRRTILPTRDPS